MSIEKGLVPLTFPASADLSARQYRCVNLASDGEIALASGGAYVLGILQDKPAAVGRAGSVQSESGAVTKVFASALASTAAGTLGVVIAAGTRLRSAANGVAVATSTGGTAYVWGRANEGLSTGLTGTISATITHEGPVSTA